ncbi:TPA: hypothetical protein ACH3X3_000399 [Trebouxia sp. C0006]
MSQRICDGCRRPKRVCLCAAYPSSPTATSGLVCILQHPLEHRRALATVPLLERSLRDCTVVRDRKFQVGKHIDLDRVLQQVTDGALKGFLLFPGPGSQDLDAAVLAIRQDPCLRCWPHCSSRASILASPHQRTTQQAQQGGTTQLHSNTHHANSGHAASGAPATPKHTGSTAYVRSLEPLNSSTSALASATDCALPALERDQQHICAETDAEQSNGHLQYVLFAIDGTWQEAKEIYKAVAPRLLASTSGIQQVQLPCFKNNLDHATLALRGSIASCPTSTPCQVRAQQANEESTQQGVEPGSWLLRTEPAEGYVTTAEAVSRAVALIEADDASLLDQLLAPLKLMTQLQAKYNPSLQLRLDKQACKERLSGGVK